MKQTSIEWLVDQLKKFDLSRDNVLIVIPLFIWKEKVEQAKEMEKEQSIAELRHKDGTPMRKYNSPKLQEIEMENKQTSVEWLFEKLWETPKDKFTWHSILEQAKEIEKQEIIDILEWLTNEKSEYSIMYGNQKKRFASNEKDYTIKEILEIYKNRL